MKKVGFAYFKVDKWGVESDFCSSREGKNASKRDKASKNRPQNAFFLRFIWSCQGKVVPLQSITLKTVAIATKFIVKKCYGYLKKRLCRATLRYVTLRIHSARL